MVAHPAERGEEVELAEIAAIGEARPERLQPGISERIEPLVDGHHDDIALDGEPAAVGERIGDRSAGVGAAVEIDHDRPPSARVRFGRPDIEEQAVLALRLLPQAGLRCDRAK